LPKKVVLVQNLFIGQEVEIKPTLEEAGMNNIIRGIMITTCNPAWLPNIAPNENA
jgi:hypothetical protein